MLTQTSAEKSSEFSIARARSIVGDLFSPSPRIYWTDFLASWALGVGAFVAARVILRFQGVSAATLTAAVPLSIVACLALYRTSLFTHELAHLRKGTFRRFRLAWNVLFGIPTLMPSYLYQIHLVHHMRKHYGTKEDGEYLPLASRPVWMILGYLAECLVIPLIAIVRFLVLAPLSWLSPTLRTWLHRHLSSMVIDPTYVRPLPTREDLRAWRLEEAGCFGVAAAAVAGVALGLTPPSLFVHIYIMAVGILLLNEIRTLGAHRFHHQGEPVTFIDQLLDSINYPDRPLLTELWAPVGLRFHALHHLFPALPYHNLPEAHRRLMRELPADSPYRATNSPGLLHALGELWQSARRASREPAPRERRAQAAPHWGRAASALKTARQQES